MIEPNGIGLLSPKSPQNPLWPWESGRHLAGAYTCVVQITMCDIHTPPLCVHRSEEGMTTPLSPVALYLASHCFLNWCDGR